MVLTRQRRQVPGDMREFVADLNPFGLVAAYILSFASVLLPCSLSVWLAIVLWVACAMYQEDAVYTVDAVCVLVDRFKAAFEEYS